MSSWQKTALLSLLLFGFVVRAVFCWTAGPNELYRFVTDDSLINFAVAHHAAKGDGFKADGIHYTNSAHFIAALAGVPFQALYLDDKLLALRCTLTVSALFAAASGLFLFLLAKHYADTISALVTLFLFVTSPIWFAVSMTGMDPAYTVFFLSLQLYCYYVVVKRGESGSRLHYLGLGVTCGLAFASRTDQALFTVLICIDLAIKCRHTPRAMLVRNSLVLAGFLSVACVIGFNNFTNTGEWLPSSFKLYDALKEVGAELLVLNTGREELYRLFQGRPYVIHLGIHAGLAVFAFLYLGLFSPWGLLGLILVLSFGETRKRLFTLLPRLKGLYILAVASSVYYFAYCLYFVNPYLYRYLTPVYVPLILLEGIAIGTAREAFKEGLARRALFRVAIVVVTVLSLLSTSSYRLAMDWAPKVPEWINENVEEGAVVATASYAGSLTYLTNATVVDLCGKLFGDVIPLYGNKRMEAFLNEAGVTHFVDKECYIRAFLRGSGAAGYLDEHFEKIRVFGPARNPECRVTVFKRKDTGPRTTYSAHAH